MKIDLNDRNCEKIAWEIFKQDKEVILSNGQVFTKLLYWWEDDMENEPKDCGQFGFYAGFGKKDGTLGDGLNVPASVFKEMFGKTNVEWNCAEAFHHVEISSEDFPEFRKKLIEVFEQNGFEWID